VVVYCSADLVVEGGVCFLNPCVQRDAYPQGVLASSVLAVSTTTYADPLLLRACRVCSLHSYQPTTHLRIKLV